MNGQKTKRPSLINLVAVVLMLLTLTQLPLFILLLGLDFLEMKVPRVLILRVLFNSFNSNNF